MMRKKSQQSRPVHVDVDVVSMSKSKWATAVIRQIVDSYSQGPSRSSETIPPVTVGDKVSVHPKYHLHAVRRVYVVVSFEIKIQCLLPKDGSLFIVQIVPKRRSSWGSLGVRGKMARTHSF